MGYNKPAWIDALYAERFFVNCSFHEMAKKNEKNVLCLDCCISMCPHCLPMHRFHRLIQIRRYVYHDVIRLEDLEKLIDCSNVQAYTINSAKVIFIKMRPQNRQFKGAGNYCTSCDRSLQEPYIHCSLGCKVDYVLKHYKDLSPYLRVCKTLTLSPDFLYPQDMMDDYSYYTSSTAAATTAAMTNQLQHSTIVDDDDYDEPPMVSSSTTNSSGSTGSDDAAGMRSSTSSAAMMMYNNHSADQIVRKKRSSGGRMSGSFNINGYFSNNRAVAVAVSNSNSNSHHHYHHQSAISDEDMASSMNRRKGVPHRSPFC